MLVFEMVAMVMDTMLTTSAPACAFAAPRPQWVPSSRPIRVATRSAAFKPAVQLRVSVCCSSGASTSSAGAVERREESGVEAVVSAPFGEVYVASVPLRAPKGAAEFFEVMQDVQLLADFQHFMTIIKPYGDDATTPCTVLDFQPEDPENPMTAVSVLLGNTIPGVILERTLSRLPTQRCWWVGEMKPELNLEDALRFSRGYDSELSLGVNDCRHHTMDLVDYLTGKRMTYIEEVRNVREREREEAEELEFEKRLAEAASKKEFLDVEAEEEPVEDVSVKNGAST